MYTVVRDFIGPDDRGDDGHGSGAAASRRVQGTLSEETSLPRKVP